jgi:predicted RNA binding protein YcfA (HicA-like mRNA interferase family)
MSKLSIISSKEMMKIVQALGFNEIRQKGSHKTYKHIDGRTTIIPFHGENLGRGLIRKILKTGLKNGPGVTILLGTINLSP